MAEAMVPPTLCDVNVFTYGTEVLHAQQPMGSVEIRYQKVYWQLHRHTHGGGVAISSERHSPPPISLLRFEIPWAALRDSGFYRQHLYNEISSLNLHPVVISNFVEQSASLALALAGPPNFNCYSITATLELHYLQELRETMNLPSSLFPVEFDGQDTVIFSDFQMDTSSSSSSAATKRGASRTAVKKLMKEGKVVVARESDGEELDTCSICLDDLSSSSSSSGAVKLIHMPCTHLFHRSCLIQWLKESNTCPVCRYKVADN